MRCPKCSEPITIPREGEVEAGQSTWKPNPSKESASDPTREEAGPQSTTEQNPKAQSPIERSKKVLVALLHFVRDAFGYYWLHRRPLWREIRDKATDQAFSPSLDIRLDRDEQYEGATATDSGWNVTLPECCVVCGTDTDEPAIHDERDLNDYTLAIRAPLLGLAAGLVLGIFLWNKWWIPAMLFAGFLVGYRKRRKTHVTLEFRRCKEDRNRTKTPHLRTRGNELFIRVGKSIVRKRFFGATDQHFDEIAVPTEANSPLDAPIPLPTVEEQPSVAPRSDQQRAEDTNSQNSNDSDDIYGIHEGDHRE